MVSRRVGAAGRLVVLLAAAVWLSGCPGPRTTNPEPSGRAEPSPSGLALTVGEFATTSYRFKVTANEGVYSGGIDPTRDLLDTTITISSRGASLRIDTIGVAGDYYARITGAPLPGVDGTWYRVDTSRLRSPGALGISALKDPTGVRALVAATQAVQRTSDGAYRGTVDLTKVVRWGPVNTGQLGAAARAVPFDATVDAAGRLTSIAVAIPATASVRANTVTATYSDFGVELAVSRPVAAEPLPDSLYPLLGA